MLASAEERVLPHRIAALVDLKERAEIVEANMQKQYADLLKVRQEA
jgi:hypothetical protein